MKKILIYGDEFILKNYKEAISCCGAIPCFRQDSRVTTGYDGLLLAGGGDVHPALYHQDITHCNQIEPQRDLDELHLIHFFKKRKLPILGICRGIQVINVAFGGTLLQDIPTADLHCYKPATGDQIHPISAAKDDFLYRLYGSEFTVNSAHHQGIDRLGDQLQVSAFSEDGVIEAISCTRLPIYGVQFHPERMSFSHKRNDTVDGRFMIEFFLSL